MSHQIKKSRAPANSYKEQKRSEFSLTRFDDLSIVQPVSKGNSAINEAFSDILHKITDCVYLLPNGNLPGLAIHAANSRLVAGFLPIHRQEVCYVEVVTSEVQFSPSKQKH